MKRKLFLSLILASATWYFWSSKSTVNAVSNIPQKYVVFMTGPQTLTTLDEPKELEPVGALLVTTIPGLDAVEVIMTPSQAEMLKNRTGVQSVEAAVGEVRLDDVKLRKMLVKESEVLSYGSDTPNDTSDDGVPPGVARLGGPAAWPQGATGKGITVCITDTGVNWQKRDAKGKRTGEYVEHPDLAGAVIDGKDFTNTPGNIKGADDHMHGTHVAGTIGARGTLKGVAPEVTLLSAKVLSAQGSGHVDGIVQGIGWCVEKKANIISASWGSAQPSGAIRDAVRKATEKGVYFSAASGNSASKVGFPAGHIEEGAIAIGALGTHHNGKKGPFDQDDHAWFSNFGPELFVATPGVDVTSTKIDGGYLKASGTSMACPHFSGILAAILSKYPKISRAELLGVIAYGSLKLPVDLSTINRDRNDKFGWGVPSIPAALDRIGRYKTE
jgi:subtilisin family serine protease